VKKIFVLPFFVAANITKLKKNFIFEQVKKKLWATLQRIIELFTQKIVITLSKYRFDIRDPGSKSHRIAAATILIYNNKPDLIEQELGRKVVLLGERGDGEGAALL